MNLRESLFRALDSLSESSIIHNGKKFSNVKRFDDDKSANDFIEKNPGHGVLHADKGGVYVAHNKNKGVKHTYTAHNEETELDEVAKAYSLSGRPIYGEKAKRIQQAKMDQAVADEERKNKLLKAKKEKENARESYDPLDENAPQHVPGKKWDESKEKWVTIKRPDFDPKKERGRPSTPDQGQKRSDFDEEADLTKIDTKRLQSMVQMHKHYGQKNPASKAAADRGEAELKSRMKKEEVDLDEAVNEKQIRKDLDSGMSHDVVIGKHANKKTDNTDAIRKVIKQHAWDKRMKKESVEGLAEGRPSQAHPLAGHDYHKKSNDQLEYIRKDAHAAAEAMKDHNPTAENKYRDQASDASSVLHFRKTSGTPDWYKKKYGHIKESVDLDEAKTDVYHQHMLKALGKTKLPKDHPYTSAVANNGDFVVHNNGKVVGRIPKGEHSIKEESSLPPHLAKLIDPKTGNMKDPEKQKIYDDMMKRRQGMAKAKAKMAEETSSVAKDATVKSTKSNVTANTNTTTPYDVKPQRIKSAEFNKLHN